jgi:hypothetical protein
MPSTRGMGSKIIFRLSGSVSSTRADKVMDRSAGAPLKGKAEAPKPIPTSFIRASFGPYAEAPVPAEPLGVGEFEGRDGEKRLPRGGAKILR